MIFGLQLYNWEDGILLNHPEGKGHHGGVEYWKISSGPAEPIHYDMNGNIVNSNYANRFYYAP